MSSIMSIRHTNLLRCIMDKKEQIQKRIAEAILKSKLTQNEIAIRLNIRQSNISHYIKGDKMPSVETLANLCNILKLDANKILGVNTVSN